VLPRHVARTVEGREGRLARIDPTGFRIDVAGNNRYLCEGLVEACVTAGYRALAVDDLDAAGRVDAKPAASSPAERALTIWDVPVLEPDWAERLERRARLTGPVIALFGFADRDDVVTAKARGAVACLELPYDVDDLIDVVDRVGRSIPADKWPKHLRVELPHRLPPRPRRRKPEPDKTTGAVPWSDRDRKPTMS
jgi:DNA-binding response OmpR family regulator